MRVLGALTLALGACAREPIPVPEVLRAPSMVAAQLDGEHAVVSWPEVANATGYFVRRSPDGSVVEVTQSPVSLELPELDVGYRFTVTTRKGEAHSAPSKASNEVVRRSPPLTAPPAAPTGVTAVAADAQVTLDWSPSADAEKYHVVSEPPDASLLTDGPHVVVRGLRNGVRYRFGVSSQRAMQSSALAWSDFVVPAGPPGAPRLVTASARSGAASVSWWPPEDVGGVAIDSWEVASSPAGHSLTVSRDASSADVTGLTNGVAVQFTVRAHNRVGFGAASEPSGAVTPAESAQPPTAVTATKVSRGTALVTWAAPSDTGGLPIVRYLVRVEPSGRVELVSGAQTSVVISGLPTATLAVFRVATLTSVGLGALSAGSTPLLLADAPAAPSDVQMVPGASSGFVSWLPPSDTGGAPVTGYRVDTEVDGSISATTMATGGGTAHRIANLVAGKRYRFHVRARTIAGESAAAVSALGPPLRCVTGLPNPPMLEIAENATGGSALRTGDFNGDGIADALVWSEYSLTLATLTDRGTVARTERYPSSYVTSAIVADLNRDGRLDAATPFEVLINTGGPTTFAAHPLALAGSRLEAGDVDGDGDVDLVSGVQDGLMLLLNDGSGIAFQPRLIPFVAQSIGCQPMTFPPCSVLRQVRDFSLADFDGDGSIDIAAANADGASLFLELGAPAVVRHDLANTTNARALVATDWNGDHQRDLLVTDYSKLRLWLGAAGDPAGNHPPVQEIDWNFAVASLIAADIDGDGWTDLTLAGYPRGSFALEGRVMNVGGSQLMPDVRRLDGVTGIEYRDLDHDGATDYLALTNGGLEHPLLAVVLRRFGDPFEQLGEAVGLPYLGTQPIIAVGDFDGDGTDDIAGGGASRTYRVVDGGLQPFAPSPPLNGTFSDAYRCTAVADFDHDGRDDLAVAGDPIRIFSSFDAGFVLSQELVGTRVVVGDFNGDGLADLVSNDSLFWGSASGALDVSAQPLDLRGLAAGDLNGDGVDDLVGALPTGTWGVWSYGHPTISIDISFDLPWALRDVTGDGIVDLITGTPVYNLTPVVAVGESDGGFTHRTTIMIPGAAPIGRFADFDGDGDLDLLTGTIDSTPPPHDFTISWNDGTGAFPSHSSYPSIELPAWPVLIDANHDGRPDLAISNARDVALHLNVCAE